MDGILVVDKPKGVTSHDVVDFIRKRFTLKKVGHAGTLDPMATGVLVILIGRATKSSQVLTACDKEYEAMITLGAVSDTGDALGKVTPTGVGIECSREHIEDVFSKFIGEIEQRPPMYSAIKHKGKRLYALARKGISVEVKPRKVFIKELEILDMLSQSVSFRLVCSKGTYVRSLAVDIGNRLGCGAYLSRLVRTRSGDFTIKEAVSVEELKNMPVSELEKKVAG